MALPLSAETVPGTYLEFIQGRKKGERVILVRCPSCNGLRSGIAKYTKPDSLCGPCKRGDVVPRSRYHNYWLERYSKEEIYEMAAAIWG